METVTARKQRLWSQNIYWMTVHAPANTAFRTHLLTRISPFCVRNFTQNGQQTIMPNCWKLPKIKSYILYAGTLIVFFFFSRILKHALCSKSWIWARGLTVTLLTSEYLLFGNKWCQLRQLDVTFNSGHRTSVIYRFK